MVLFFLFLMTLSLWGYPSQDLRTIKVSVKQVYLPVRVFENSMAVRGLRVENFRVWEEFKNEQGQKERLEQKVENVTAYQDVALAIAVTLDSSGSMKEFFNLGQVLAKDKLTIARNASKDFFQTIFREGHDRGLVSEFYFRPAYYSPDGRKLVPASSLRIRQDWTPHLQEILWGIEGIKRPGGATPLRDAVFQLTSRFSELDGNFLRILVVLSDGGDAGDPKPGEILVNMRRLPEVISQLEDQQILVFAIGTFRKSWPTGFGSKDPNILEAMARATGGQAFFEDDLSKLVDVFQKIGQMIRDVNFLSYTLQNEMEGPRTIEMEVGEWDENGKWRRKKATIFHRKGYYYRAN